MVREKDSIFSITHSLPVIGHSVAISNRTPTTGYYSQKTKYTPDYGGTLDTPDCNLKNNTLASGIPFRSRSNLSALVKHRPNKNDNNPTAKISIHDCLILKSYLQSEEGTQLTTIRAIGESLYLDTITETWDSGQSDYSRISGAFIPYGERILGIKDLLDFVLVRSARYTRIFRLNKSNEDDLSLYDNSDEQMILKQIVSIRGRSGFNTKDACLNQVSNLAVASDNINFRQVKLYDLSDHASQSFYTITWPSNKSDETSTIDNLKLRGRAIPNYVSMKPSIRGIQQVDNIPSHLINILVTSDDKTVLIDPRMDREGQCYVNKCKIPSFYPMEYIRRTEFSKRNSYQLYSLTNIHLRVFDTRYPSVPMNQINHMLDSSTYEAMHLKVINRELDNLETLCMSSNDRLSFSSFDQSGEASMVNPKAVHLPYHESNIFSPSPDEHPDAMFGLGVKINEPVLNDSVFSVLQLTSDGDTCIKEFTQNHGDPKAQSDNDALVILQHGKSLESGSSVRKRRVYNANLIENVSKDREKPPESDDYIDILNPKEMANIEEIPESRRARERFEKMKNILDGG